jgi:predicted RNA-binding protein with PUA domain
LGHSVSHSLQSTFPISYVGIVIMIAGFGLIAYKVLEEKFQRKITQAGVKSIMDKDEIDQIDRQDSERNEEVDRYTPANVK